MNKNKIITILLCFSLSFGLFFTSFADNNTDLNKKAEEKNEIKSEIKQQEAKKQQQEKEIDAIEVKLNNISVNLENINGNLTELNNKKNIILSELKQAEENYANQMQTLKKRLRVVHEEGALSYLNILFSSESIFDFFYNLEIIKQISEYDDKVLADIEKSKETIINKKAEVDVVISKETEKKEEQVKLKSTLDVESDKKVAIMKELESDIEALRKKVKQIESEEATIRAEIARLASLKNPTIVYSGGQFAWPAPGVSYITSSYGMRLHPTLKVNKLHTGIDLAAPMGTTVVAAADGEVIVSGWSNAYGRYITINHGNGLATLYAHNSQLLVSKGQIVTKGQPISRSGNTGYSTGPHLHFEVLKNGSAVNPMPYLN